mmetsp:Transcript_16103/g.39234  ORF Transcript_16103/g.39234 Transcript_16103/m.39234 type:complete len:422 (-) Transcript_16103:538-1803(-)
MVNGCNSVFIPVCAASSVVLSALGRGHVQRADVVELHPRLDDVEEALLHLRHGLLAVAAGVVVPAGHRRLLRRVLHLLLPRLEVLLALGLALEHLVDAGLLVGLHRAQPLAQLHQRGAAVRGAHRDQAPRVLDIERGQRAVRHLDAQRGVVLLVVVVPHVQLAVRLDGEEHAGARGAPGASREVGAVVARGHDGRPDVLHPHARAPVPDGHEVLGEERVALQRVHRPVVPVVRRADAVLRVLGLAVAHQHRALLGADHELGGARDALVLQRHRAHHRVAVLLLEHEVLHRLAQAPRVPPVHVPVRGHRGALRARLGLQPGHVVARVAVRLLDGRAVHRRVPLADVPVADLAVVHAAAEDVGVLGVVVDAAQLAGALHLEVRLVGVVHVPDVRALAHALRLLLEPQDAVRNRALAVVHVGVP